MKEESQRQQKLRLEEIIKTKKEKEEKAAAEKLKFEKLKKESGRNLRRSKKSILMSLISRIRQCRSLMIRTRRGWPLFWINHRSQKQKILSQSPKGRRCQLKHSHLNKGRKRLHRKDSRHQKNPQEVLDQAHHQVHLDLHHIRLRMRSITMIRTHQGHHRPLKSQKTKMTLPCSRQSAFKTPRKSQLIKRHTWPQSNFCRKPSN